MENHYHYNIIAKAIAFIRENYEDQPRLEEVAEFVHMSKFHFQRIFKEWAGISPKEFLQYITIEHAKRSLSEGRSTFEAAWDVGLSGNSRLHDLFVKIEACTPGEFQNQGKGLTINIAEFDSPFGKAAVAETSKGISGLIFGSADELKSTRHFKNARFNNQLGSNGQLVKNYFTGWKIPSEQIRLYLPGTPFQIQVWKALLLIPSSNLMAYRDIAEKIDRPGAIRAVGTAVGSNPVAYLIPCHRVINGNGEFGNYRWEPDRKKIINGYEAAVLS